MILRIRPTLDQTELLQAGDLAADRRLVQQIVGGEIGGAAALLVDGVREHSADTSSSSPCGSSPESPSWPSRRWPKPADGPPPPLARQATEENLEKELEEELEVELEEAVCV